MVRDRKSYDLQVTVPDGTTPGGMRVIVERAARSIGLYISNIGGYSRKKYPNAVHWHFKRDKREAGLIDATYWDVKSAFWLMVRYSEPAWVHAAAPLLQCALDRELRDQSGARLVRTSDCAFLKPGNE